MRDKILDFIEDHRILVIIGIVLVIIIGILFGIRSSNIKKKEAAEVERLLQEQLAAQEAENAIEEVTTVVQPVGDYEASLGLAVDKSKDERVQVKPEEEVEVIEDDKPEQTEPNYNTDVVVFGYQEIPTSGLNANLFQNYLSKVSLSNFSSKFGSSLTESDFFSPQRILVGYEKDRAENDTDMGDLHSVGWITNNIDKLGESDAIKFVDLHVVGHLSTDHVALLCTYELYAANHLEDMLVVFEDISGTLSIDNFKSGDIFSATVFKHNMKVENVNGETVLVVQYNTF